MDEKTNQTNKLKTNEQVKKMYENVNRWNDTDCISYLLILARSTKALVIPL